MSLRSVVTKAQIQGPRDYQEDYLVCEPFASTRSGRGYLLGVMDGHGGGEVAKYCAEFAPRLFDPGAEDVGQALREVVAQLDARTALADAGTTVSLVCVNESQKTATTAVLGDSPIVLIARGGYFCVSDEHNVRTNAGEREAAIRRGAMYEDGYIFNAPDNPDGLSHEDGLQLSRALGDRSLRNILDRTPVIRQYHLDSESFILLASDGLLDPSHEHSSIDIIHVVLEKGCARETAEDILRWREGSGLEDNTSLILWRAKRWWDWS